jgi:hypothetical protein
MKCVRTKGHNASGPWHVPRRLRPVGCGVRTAAGRRSVKVMSLPTVKFHRKRLSTARSAFFGPRRSPPDPVVRMIETLEEIEKGSERRTQGKGRHGWGGGGGEKSVITTKINRKQHVASTKRRHELNQKPPTSEVYDL